MTSEHKITPHDPALEIASQIQNIIGRSPQIEEHRARLFKRLMEVIPSSRAENAPTILTHLAAYGLGTNSSDELRPVLMAVGVLASTHPHFVESAIDVIRGLAKEDQPAGVNAAAAIASIMQGVAGLTERGIGVPNPRRLTHARPLMTGPVLPN